MELQANPLLTLVEQTPVVVPIPKSLEETAKFIETLQPDIQQYLKDEYIKPQLVNELITSLYKVLDSQECQRLQWEPLVDPVSKIIAIKDALSQLQKQNELFRYIYHKYIIKNSNSLEQFGPPINRLCVEWVMCKYH
jgi:hypothetical protein